MAKPTDERARPRDERDAPAAGEPSRATNEQMNCPCAKMMPQMMSMCGGAEAEQDEAIAEPTGKE